jgi:hypothetical protein
MLLGHGATHAQNRTSHMYITLDGNEQRFRYTKTLIPSKYESKVDLGMKVKIDRVSHMTLLLRKMLLRKMQEQSLLRIQIHSPGRKAPTINAFIQLGLYRASNAYKSAMRLA